MLEPTHSDAPMHDRAMPALRLLSPRTVADVRNVIRWALSGGDLDDEMCAALYRLGRAARAEHLAPEQLVIVLRDLWNAESRVRGEMTVDEAETLRLRLTQLTLDAYAIDD